MAMLVLITEYAKGVMVRGMSNPIQVTLHSGLNSACPVRG